MGNAKGRDRGDRIEFAAGYRPGELPLTAHRKRWFLG